MSALVLGPPAEEAQVWWSPNASDPDRVSSLQGCVQKLLRSALRPHDTLCQSCNSLQQVLPWLHTRGQRQSDVSPVGSGWTPVLVPAKLRRKDQRLTLTGTGPSSQARWKRN